MASPRSASAWWQISSGIAAAVTVLAVQTGRGMFAWIFAFWAIISLYGAVDHVVEPALAELATPVAPTAVASPEQSPEGAAGLTSRQRRVLRFLAYGLLDDEIAQLLQVDEPTVRADVDEILAVMAVHDRAAAVEAARHAGVLTGGRAPRFHAAA